MSTNAQGSRVLVAVDFLLYPLLAKTLKGKLVTCYRLCAHSKYEREKKSLSILTLGAFSIVIFSIFVFSLFIVKFIHNLATRRYEKDAII